MAKKEEAAGGRGKQRQRPVKKQSEERPSTGGRGKQREF